MVHPGNDVNRSSDLHRGALVRRLGRSVIFGGILPVGADGRLVGRGDIEAQTDAVFRNLRAMLDAAGMRITDLVRLNTYYIGDVPEGAVTRYWERMTRVRLQHLKLPGPAAMAVRVDGTAIDGALIELEGEAIAESERHKSQRIMPADSWGWSVPVPFSQGWRVGDRVWVGGQISADHDGRAVHSGDPARQAQEVMTFIRNVLEDAGASTDDLCQLKICYRHTGDSREAESRLEEIMQVVRENCGTVPPITAFGANLLYDGLVLEIDGAAVIGAERRAMACPGCQNLNWTAETYGVRMGRHIQFSGYTPPVDVGGNLLEGVRSAVQLFVEALAAIDVSPETIARLNVFRCAATSTSALSGLLADMTDAVRDIVGGDAPPITLVRSTGLPGGGIVQVDGYCLVE